MRKLVKSLLILLAFSALTTTTTQLSAAGKPGGGCPTPKHACICPDIVAPVICDGGCTYVNSCQASCAGARNCVPNPI